LQKPGTNQVLTSEENVLQKSTVRARQREPHTSEKERVYGNPEV
jgi:hypothetical protein